MINFTPISAVIGGFLIGISAVLLMLLNGRVTGITGMHGLAAFKKNDSLLRALFLLGLI